MKKLFITVFIIFMSVNSAFAAKIPDNVKNFVKKDFQKADFRFDGLITLPDGTMYLPLYPALVKKPEKFEVKYTIPASSKLALKPDVIVFNNDFTLVKIIVDSKGRKSVINVKQPPVEIRTGLLPQDMLVPTGLIIPDNIKGIIGNLNIPTAKDAGLRVVNDNNLQNKTIKTNASVKNLVSSVPQLANKVMYITTCYAKNIQVVNGEGAKPAYALAQSTIPYSIAASADDKFLLVTVYGKTFVDIVSLADERVIKQIDLSTPAEEIVVDKLKNKAYVSSSADSSIYVIDLNSMTLKQKIKVKGSCQKISLSDDGTKLFYTDKKTNDIWLIELNHNFVIKNIGSFPNVSCIRFANGKIYIASRTKAKIAIIDYVTLGLITEIDVEAKPIDMLTYKNNLFVLSAQTNTVEVINTINDVLSQAINLDTFGFSTCIYAIKNTNLAIVTDTRTNKYSVIDLDKKLVIKTNSLDVPVSQIVITPDKRRK